MNKISQKTAFCFYEFLWKLATPLLARNHRLAEGFGQRTLDHGSPPRADLWIQAASAGESYLTRSLIGHPTFPKPLDVLLTSNTRQGMDILEQTVADTCSDNSGIHAHTAYFPFDRPSLMDKAVRAVRPKVMVLLETEIWPGLLSALKRRGSKILIVNGRISEKNLRTYLLWPSLWRSLRPDRVLAVSPDDAERFSLLFGSEGVEVMRNMKFDGIGEPARRAENPLPGMFPPDMPVVVLGSTGEEEEPEIEKIILFLRDRHPNTSICLFPRHMHRIRHWMERLEKLGLPAVSRSGISHGLREPKVILWDTFGELSWAYELASAAFVGGSLAPLGGQNFLEALSAGLIPVIGPFWDSFHWVGREISDQGLVRVAKDWRQAAHMLSDHLRHPPCREKVRESVIRYVKGRQGGTARACEAVAAFLGDRA